MCAAVADYAPAEQADRKIKREHSEVPVIRLVKNPDIAATLGAVKRAGQMLVGFALETDNGRANAVEKLERKNLDMIVLNSAVTPGTGFGTDTNAVTVIERGNENNPVELSLKSKEEIAGEIVDIISGKI